MKWIAIAILSCSGLAAQEDGKALMQRACTKCHALTSMLGQHYNREGWSAVVDDMISKGAEATDAEIEKIIDYLVKTQGPKIKVNKATPQELAGALEIPVAVAGAVLEYREKHGSFKSFEELKKAPALEGTDIESKKERLDFSEVK
jgi:competence protein ComEA